MKANSLSQRGSDPLAASRFLRVCSLVREGQTPFRKGSNRKPHGRTAYVLMIVIAVSVLVVTVLGTLAKQSLRRGLAAADAERSLQQRWGALTLEKEILQVAPKVFELQHQLVKARDPAAHPPTSIRAAVTLRDVTFDLLLGDEDAKLNVNSMYHHVGQQRTEQAIRELSGVGAAMSVRLLPCVPAQQIARDRPRIGQPADTEEEPPAVPNAFRSWGEVFDLTNLEAQIGSDLPNVTTGMTCWGNGQLNFQRASEQAILAVVGAVVQDGGAQRILTRFQRNPAISLEILLQSEVSNQLQRDRLKELLSETSTNFSIWIDASTKTLGSMRTFAVTRRDDEGVIRHSRFMH
jgi:hypothetical protein